MAEEFPGNDDGPSRPGIGLRRTVIVVISGLLIICTPFVAWVYWGMARPGPGPFSSPRPSEPYRPAELVATVSLVVARVDQYRFVEAVDRFAFGRGFADDGHLTGPPIRESPLVSLAYKTGQTEIKIRNTSSEPTVLVVGFYERAGAEAGAGQRLRAAFEDNVIRAGGFGP